MDVISDRIDINVLKTPLSTCSPVSGHIKIILETVIYIGEKSLLVLIYSSDSYNLGALADKRNPFFLLYQNLIFFPWDLFTNRSELIMA